MLLAYHSADNCYLEGRVALLPVRELVFAAGCGIMVISSLILSGFNSESFDLEEGEEGALLLFLSITRFALHCAPSKRDSQTVCTCRTSRYTQCTCMTNGRASMSSRDPAQRGSTVSIGIPKQKRMHFTFLIKNMIFYNFF